MDLKGRLCGASKEKLGNQIAFGRITSNVETNNTLTIASLPAVRIWPVCNFSKNILKLNATFYSSPGFNDSLIRLYALLKMIFGIFCSTVGYLHF